MKKVYPRYAEQVAFYAVGTDPTESLEHLEEVRQKADYPWPVAVQNSNLTRDLRVVVQSTKIAFDAQGVIIYREGFGKGGPDEWHQVFKELAMTPATRVSGDTHP